MKVTVWKRLLAPGRKSDLVMALVLIALFFSFEISDRSHSEMFKHFAVAFGFIWMYLRYLKQADYAVDSLSDSLKKHGIDLSPGADPTTAADAASDRLDKYASEVSQLMQERKALKDQRLIEMAKSHQDLLTHHRCTKKMLGSFRTEEVFESLVKGVRDGLGFQGTALGMLDRDGNIVFREELAVASGPMMIQVPAWQDGSVIANAVWTGNTFFSQTLDEHSHSREDKAVLGEGPFFVIPIIRKLDSKCSDIKNCSNTECPSYLSRNGRCWIENYVNCLANADVPRGERRKSCVLCEMFATAAVLAVGTRMESRKVSRENVVPIVTLANEASMALGVVDLHENMRKMSITDGLTGLYNHREFYQQLRRELERARRYRHTVSLLIIDVDDFKKFNDNFGHLAGDLALRKIADLLRGCARATDIVARYGGEEFAVILPESSAAGSLMLAERIKTEVARHSFLPQSAEEVHLTVSIGIYTAEEGASTEDQIVRYADEAAYAAKGAGKNRVVVKTNA